MCGIAGFVSPGTYGDKGQAWLEPLKLLEHRGPDDHGWLVETKQGLVRGRDRRCPAPWRTLLLHRRLSILDLSEAGWQPMVTASGRQAIVFNGEIYNYRELREELRHAGCVFTSQSDTEVLLQAYAVWGSLCLSKLTGMFAFAVLDLDRQSLLLARDPFGIKPLYYTWVNGLFAFASELKALLNIPGLGRHVHPARLRQYLELGWTDHGSGTLLADVHQVPAAHSLELSLDRAAAGSLRRYWKPDLRGQLDFSFAEAADHLRDMFIDNVRLHLRSDVPVGAALSGGIDSSSIVAVMRHLEPRLDLHTFSFVADDPTINEETWVDRAGQHSRATMHKVTADSGDWTADLEHLCHVQDEPFGSTSIYAQHRVFRLAHESGIKVMLDGQGADELLAGYRTFLPVRLASLVRQGRLDQALAFAWRASKLPGSSSLTYNVLQLLRSVVPTSLWNRARHYIGRGTEQSCLNQDWFTQFPGPEPGEPVDTGNNLLREALYRSLTESSLPMLLRYEDRNSMAWSIESRVPFLTTRLVEFLLRLPESYLLASDGTSKNVLRHALRGLVPEAILQRRDKIGFATPEAAWLTKHRAWVERMLSSDAARGIPVWNLAAVQADWQETLASKRPFTFRIWRWLNFIHWTERWNVTFAPAPRLSTQRQSDLAA